MPGAVLVQMPYQSMEIMDSIDFLIPIYGNIPEPAPPYIGHLDNGHLHNVNRTEEVRDSNPLRSIS